MTAYRFATLFVVGMTVSTPAAQAQTAGGGGGRGVVAVTTGAGFKITESAPIEVTPVKNAPFAGEAVTEFTQTLEDGNRIERRYQSSVARDSRGRTRREEEIALIGPLASAHANAPRLVTIVDPDSGVSYTLDEAQRVAFRSLPAGDKKLLELTKLAERLKVISIDAQKSASPLKGAGGRGVAAAELKKAEADLQKRTNTEEQATVQDLGVRSIEGVRAQGTRTTTTIAAGVIGNIRPIEIVSERWFSPELQMPVLITRRDPRNGETTYRLTNILRGEQPDWLFTVPGGYEVKEGSMKFKSLDATKAKKLEVASKP
jgi:hypothetical protein